MSVRGALDRIVDCDIHPVPKGREAFRPYLSDRWRRHLAEHGAGGHGVWAARAVYPRFQPAAARRDAWPPAGGPPGSDLDFLRTHHLDPNGVAYGMMMPLVDATSSRNVDLATAMCTAVNDWQVDVFAGPEPRLKAAVVVDPEDAVAAAAEIRRRADDPRFAQVQIGTRAIEPLGRRRYWPVYAAAEETGFPVGFHVGGATASPPSAGGWPSHYVEYLQVVGHTGAALLASLILEGVFDRFPRLTVVVVECGFAWVPAFAWRLDRHFERMRSEVPDLGRRPSEYLRDHVRFTTQPIEEPEDPQDFRWLIETIGCDRLMFSTDYPHWDYDDPRRSIPVALSEGERQRLFFANALATYRNLDPAALTATDRTPAR